MLPPGVDMKHYKWDSFTSTFRPVFLPGLKLDQNINNLLLFLIISSSKSHKQMSSPEHQDVCHWLEWRHSDCGHGKRQISEGYVTTEI